MRARRCADRRYRRHRCRGQDRCRISDSLTLDSQRNDGAAHRWTSGLRNGMLCKDRGDCTLKLVTHGFRALLSEGDISIIDAPAIYLTELAVVGNEDGCFRSHCGVGCVHQGLLRVSEDVGTPRKLRLMTANYRSCVLRVWIDPPELDSGWTVLLLQTQHFGLVAIGDGAI